MRTSLASTYYGQHDAVIKRVFMVMMYSFPRRRPDTAARYQQSRDDAAGEGHTRYYDSFVQYLVEFSSLATTHSSSDTKHCEKRKGSGVRTPTTRARLLQSRR